MLDQTEKINLTETPRVCLNNKYLFSIIKSFFKLNNYSLTENINKANIIIINTCGLTDNIIEENLNYINKIQQKYPDKKIIVFGCLTEIYKKMKENNQFILIGPKDINKFSELFNNSLKCEDIRSSQLITIPKSPEMDDSCKGFIQISQGCSNKCSYCNVKIAKGETKSKSIENIIKETENLISSGINEITLLSDDCGSYGLDIDTNLPQIVNRILDLNEKIKLRIYTIYPSFFIKYYQKLKRRIAEGRITYICIPIQSGSGKILKLMNRRYNLNKIKEIIKDIRKINSEIVLYTHIIYNFPRENEHDFQRSLEIAKLFDFVFFLPYDDNIRTVASKITPKCNELDLEKKYNTISKMIQNKKLRGIVLKKNVLSDHSREESIINVIEMERCSLTLCIEFGCNCKCINCMLNDIIGKLKPMSFNDFKNKIDGIKPGRYERLILSGAEVTVNEKLDKFIDYAKKSGKFKHIQLQTNGRKFSNIDYCNKIISSGADEFFVSVLGGNAEIHDKMTKIKGSFDETIRGIENLTKMNMKVMTNTVITKHNYKSLANIVNLVSKSGIKIMHFWNYWPMEKYDKSDLIVNIGEMRPYLIRALETCTKKGIIPIVKHFPPCLIKQYSKYVSNCLSETIIDEKYWKEFDKNQWKCLFSNKCLFAKEQDKCEGLSLAYIHKFGWEEEVLKPISNKD